jgi:hypothetical protein
MFWLFLSVQICENWCGKQGLRTNKLIEVCRRVPAQRGKREGQEPLKESRRLALHGNPMGNTKKRRALGRRSINGFGQAERFSDNFWQNPQNAEIMALFSADGAENRLEMRRIMALFTA